MLSEASILNEENVIMVIPIQGSKFDVTPVSRTHISVHILFPQNNLLKIHHKTTPICCRSKYCRIFNNKKKKKYKKTQNKIKLKYILPLY